MEKYDLADCSIIIPIEIDCPERLEHFNFQLQYLSRFFNHYELIVIEHGKEPKVKIDKSSEIQYSFIKDEEVFSLSILSNIGVSLAKNPFFFKCDADVCLHPKAFFEALERLKNNLTLDFMFPFNGVSFTIGDPLRSELIKSFDFNKLPYVKAEEAERFRQPCITLKGGNSFGLIHLFRTSVFKELGGYNEECVDWGYQDKEVVNRFRQLGHPPQQLEGYNCFHFKHPLKTVKSSQILKNIILADFPNRLNPAQLREYVKTWTRF